MSSTLKIKRNRVYVEDPDVQSQAALVLLLKKLSKDQLEHWLSFRLQFLNSHELKCYYCGKTDLKLEVDITKRAELRQLATIDHVVPLSKGGSMFDENNCVVACFTCNQKKGNDENFDIRRYRGTDSPV